MKIKKNQLNDILSIVNQIKLNKICDADIRKSILKLALELPKEIENLNKDISASRDNFFNGFDKEELSKFQVELAELMNLMRKGENEEALKKDKEIAEKYPEFTKAYTILNKDLADIQEEVVELNIENIDIERFVDAMGEQTVDITSKELSILKPIFKDDTEN